MSHKLEALKAEVRKLSPSAFEKFATWVYNYAAKLEYEAQTDDSNGIPYRDVLRVFKREIGVSRGKPNIWEGSIGGVCMADFYERTRVRGCAFKNDADMILAEWGQEKNGELRQNLLEPLDVIPVPHVIRPPANRAHIAGNTGQLQPERPDQHPDFQSWTCCCMLHGMNPMRQRTYQRAFTLTEVLIILGCIIALYSLFVLFAKPRARSSRISCLNNVKQIGLAFRMWSNDQGDKFPWLIEAYDANKCPKGDGASVCGSSCEPLDAVNDGNVTIFRSLSNELNSPKVLVCPEDHARNNRVRASSFDITQANALHNAGQISYGVGLWADRSAPSTILTMDRNVTGGILANKRRSWTGTNSTRLNAGFDNSIHAGGCGNIGFADGSADQVTPKELRRHIATANQRLSGSTVFQLPE